MDLKAFLRFKDEIDKMKRDLARAEGALEQGMSQLQKEFGCASEKEAEKLLGRLKKEKEQLEQEYGTKLTAYQEEFEDKLGG